MHVNCEVYVLWLQLRSLSMIKVTLLWFLFFCICWGYKTRLVEAATDPAPILIINQIRGNETCCQSGAVDMITQLNQNRTIANLPLAWALRFDGFQDETFVATMTALPKTQTVGLLLEITPKLASAAAVAYKGDPNGTDWYSARNALLLGYSPEERKKLLDTVFSAFYQQFKSYPTFTVAWMIDAWSLEYISTHYGVKVHELTKEQYETDNYTLYGGIFNLPFIPSREHPLVPDANGLDMLLVRQTISDLEKNYGSYHSVFTSQPNDYLSNPEKTDFEYFTQLLEQVVAQPQMSKFAVFGLENSQWQLYKDEYIHQLLLIAEKSNAGQLKPLSPQEYYEHYKTNAQLESRYLKSSTFPNAGVLWFFGKTYRARLEILNGKLTLTDLRIFAGSDPYRDRAIDVNRAYWVIPYLLDSSQQFTTIDNSNLRFQGNPVRNDPGVTRFGITLTTQKIKSVTEQDAQVSLKTDSGAVILSPDKITISGDPPTLGEPINLSYSQLLTINTPQYFTFARHPRFFINPSAQQNQITFGWENRQLEQVPLAFAFKKDATWELVPNVRLTAAQIASLSMIFQPDVSTLPFDPATSVFFWHNKTAIAGRNPIRLLIDAKNILGREAKISAVQITQTNPEAVVVHKPPIIKNVFEPFFVDFTASSATTTTVSLTVDGNIIAGKTELTFYKDCTRQLLSCLQDKKELAGFAHIILDEQKERLKTWAYDIKNKIIVKLKSFSLTKIPALGKFPAIEKH